GGGDVGPGGPLVVRPTGRRSAPASPSAAARRDPRRAGGVRGVRAHPRADDPGRHRRPAGRLAPAASGPTPGVARATAPVMLRALRAGAATWAVSVVLPSARVRRDAERRVRDTLDSIADGFT